MRRITWMAGILVGLQVLTAIPAQAATGPSVIMNQKQVEWKAKPLILANKTYVPASGLASLLSAKLVEVDGKLTFQRGSLTVSYKPTAGTQVPKGYAPLREMAEGVGYKVAWDGTKQAVTIVSQVDPNNGQGFVMVDPLKLTEEEKAFVAQNKTKPGVHKQGNLYMVALGAQPNPGYGIKLVKNEQSWEQLLVHVQRTKPEPGKMYPQMIAYPYLLGRADLPSYTTLVVIDDETGKPMIFAEDTGSK
ncbi:UNVERIFIED_CONTAM: hypothetical protein ABID98_000340 [Brevibacillus sp. OAP136]